MEQVFVAEPEFPQQLAVEVFRPETIPPFEEGQSEFESDAGSDNGGYDWAAECDYWINKVREQNQAIAELYIEKMSLERDRSELINDKIGQSVEISDLREKENQSAQTIAELRQEVARLQSRVVQLAQPQQEIEQAANSNQGERVAASRPVRKKARKCIGCTDGNGKSGCSAMNGLQPGRISKRGQKFQPKPVTPRQVRYQKRCQAVANKRDAEETGGKRGAPPPVHPGMRRIQI